MKEDPLLEELQEMVLVSSIGLGLLAFLAALAYIALFILFPIDAHAYDRRSLRAHCAFDFENLSTCRRRYRPRRYTAPYYGRQPIYDERRHYRDQEYDPSPRCKPRLSREGVEKYDVKEAQESAQSMAMEAIRNHHGVKYMDPANWEHVEFACGVSSTGNRGSERAADAAGRVLKQCTVYLKPCRAELRRENR